MVILWNVQSSYIGFGSIYYWGALAPSGVTPFLANNLLRFSGNDPGRTFTGEDPGKRFSGEGP